MLPIRAQRQLPETLATALAAGEATGSPPLFELHIRPLFRSLDREHMDFAFNLWHYPDSPGADPIGHFTLILNRLKSLAPDVVMPPPYAGGPWPQEWIDLYERWLVAGAPRLTFAQVDSNNLSASRVPGTPLVQVTVEVILPSDGHVAWLERRFTETSQFNPEQADEFIVYERMLTARPITSTPSMVEDMFELPTGHTTVKLTGQNGTFEVAVV